MRRKLGIGLSLAIYDDIDITAGMPRGNDPSKICTATPQGGAVVRS